MHGRHPIDRVGGAERCRRRRSERRERPAAVGEPLGFRAAAFAGEHDERQVSGQPRVRPVPRGDGDRIGVIDEKGTVLRCDILMTIYAREVLRNHSGAAIIGDVKCSQVMFDEIARLGGQPIMWKTGHSLIKDKIAETGAPLAGELSGHIFFADKYYGFDDALYCAVRLLNDVCESDGALSSLTKDLPVLFNTPEIRIEVDGDEKFQIVPRIIENLKNNLPAGMALDDIDGVRISNNHGWWLLRPSNTQDVLVCRAEADSEEHLERLKQMILQEVEKVGYSIDFPA